MTLVEKIFNCFKNNESFSLQEAYEHNLDKPQETVRARIYEKIGVKFERVAKGVYRTIDCEEEQCVLIEGDGRDLSMIEDNSIDCILTDHPWLDMKSNKGGTRAFALYDCFRYTLEDFKEKARVLKDGCFLVEVLPAENENNYEYLYQIKQYAKEAGFVYYSKVPWKKGTFVSNTGRKAKNTQDIMIFSKGKARSMRIDKKKSDRTGEIHYMSGCNGMLPTMFDVQPVSRKNRIHQSELPVELCEEILEYVTYELKSKSASISNKVNDGAYNTMIERITSINNPNFFFMHYNKSNLQVENFVMVPKYFFSPDIIEKRKPLADTARRAGWIGCNILLNRIPNEGRIFIIQNEKEVPIEQIIDKVHRTEFLRGSKLDARGWTLDVLNCVNMIEDTTFTLEQVYAFEKMLAIKHPDNHHVKDKIRQQLQMLRDNGIIEFIGRGLYRKIQ